MQLRRLGALVGLACILALGFVALAGTPASACSCVGPLSHRDYLRAADAAFIGDVVAERIADPDSAIQGDVRLASPEMIYSVDVRDVYKGSVPGHVEVRSAQDGASCGAGLGPNRRFMIYARADGAATARASGLVTGLCDGTHEVAGGPILSPPLEVHPADPLPPAPQAPPIGLLALAGVTLLSAAIAAALIGFAGRT